MGGMGCIIYFGTSFEEDDDNDDDDDDDDGGGGVAARARPAHL